MAAGRRGGLLVRARSEGCRAGTAGRTITNPDTVNLMPATVDSTSFSPMGGRSMALLKTKAIWHVKDLLMLGLPYQARHMHRHDGTEFQVRIKDVGAWTLRPRSADAAVVSQVFSWQQYDLSRFPQHAQITGTYRGILGRGKRPLILDLGANNGASARWFAREYPQADIVAVEPDSENARMCRLNNEGQPVQVLNAAIGSTPGHASLDTANTATLSYTTTRSSDGGVPIVTVGQILAERPGHELFIVKIDIEGFEEDLFASDTEWVQDASVILIEPHDWKFPDRETSQNLQKTMGRLPFHLLLSGENLVYVRHTPTGAGKAGRP
ncbi:MAG: FkbM family methyltransferase [Mycobacterium sp.]